jgi:hypothetical protein
MKLKIDEQKLLHKRQRNAKDYIQYRIDVRATITVTISYS